MQHHTQVAGAWPQQSTQYAHAQQTTYTNGAISNGTPKRGRRYRAPTVYEALPYTPLTSIVPVSPDILPAPIPASTASPNLFANDEHRRRTRLQLSRLDQAQGSAIHAQGLEKVRQLLGSGLTTYDFKLPARSPAPGAQVSDAPASAQPRLGGFAKMVLQNANVPYRYPTPGESPPPIGQTSGSKQISKAPLKGTSGQQQANGQTRLPKSLAQTPSAFDGQTDRKSPKGKDTSRLSHIEVPPSVPVKNSSAPHINGMQPQQTNGYVNPADLQRPQIPSQSLNGATTKANFAVVIPASSQLTELASSQFSTPTKQKALDKIATSTPALKQHTPTSKQPTPSGPAVVISSVPRANHHEYKDYTQVEAVGQKRKRDDADTGLPDMHIDQRARTDEALRSVNKTFKELIRVAEAMKTGNADFDTSFYFTQTAYNEEDTLVMTEKMQERLESSIVKAVEASCFTKMPMDSIVSVQRLCESTLSLIEALTLSIDESASGEEVEEWLQRVRFTENSLHSARIMLRILTAGREDKELYSESTLQTIADCLQLVMDRAIIPVVECRNGGSEQGLFRIYSANKKSLISLFNMYGQVLRLLSDLVAKVDVEAVIYKVQDLSTKLIFVENAYSEKDSALGSARFEKLRTRAMHVVASIFHRYPAQRQLIFNEIVTSLEKVPVARQSARQFKAHEGKSIQLVSALLMRLVQTSGTRNAGTRKQADTKSIHASEDSSEEDEESIRGSSPVKATQHSDMEVDDEMDAESAEFDLRKLADPLYQSALTDATYLVQYLVGRAQNTTKSGDQPYRKLLEIFVEDFLSVLGLPTWPGAEMLLRALLAKLFRLLSEDKTPVPAKNMALEILGAIGSGIIDLKLTVDAACRVAKDSESDLSNTLATIASDFFDQNDEQQVNKFRGPYRVAMEYLHSQSLNDVQAPTARGLHLTQWAKTTLNYLSRENEERSGVAEELPRQLRNMIIDTEWLSATYDAIDAAITPAQARLASSLITIASPTGRSLNTILDKLVSFMASPQSNLKSRSLKSVTELIEKDPSILERNGSVLHSIVRGMQDSSSQVRDSALMLLDKCLILRPNLGGDQVHTRIIQLAADDSKQVRKHAMKLLKDIYLRTNNQNLQAHISAALMLRVNDIETNVSELAQQTFEELWMLPFHKTARTDAVQREMHLKSQVVLIVKTVQRGEEAVEVLDQLLHTVLSPSSKSRASNLEVCKDMVRLMFDEIIDNEERPDRPSQQHLAQALTVFAKAEPTIFSSDQLRLLIPYIDNLTTVEHLLLYRYVALIMRHVIPTLSLADTTLLQEIQGKLLVPVSKLGKEELAEAAACLWTLHGILKNEKIVNLLKSVLIQVEKRKDIKFEDAANEKFMAQVRRYMAIAGYFGRECNFDEYKDTFKAAFPSWQGKSVSSLIIDLFCPFTRQKYPQALREAALDSIATVCQSWPQHYQRSDVSTAFDLVFRNDDKRFMQVVLSGFLLFFKQEERKSETGAAIKVGDGAKTGTERLQKSFIAGDGDTGATTIAQKFLTHILRSASSSIDDLAVTATQVIASINRQGLVHPKECGPILVVLETSTNKTISDIAFAEHKTQHLKHESHFDKEYMRAIQQTFEYQRDIVGDPRGVTLQPTTPKFHLLFEVLKTGSGKVRKRFLGNLVQKLDFAMESLDVKGTIPDSALFARFILENLSFFDYVRVDELVHLVSCLEKLVVHGIGTVVAHAIEIEILKVQLPEASQTDASQQGATDHPMNGDVAPPQSETPITAERLRQLTVASMILTMVWETRSHLRQLWGLAKQNKNGVKPQAKDLNRPATKTPFYRSEILERLESIMGALDDPAAQLAQCKIFAEIVSVDSEHKVADEDDDEAELARQAAGYETPDEEHETASNPSSTGKGRKRKGSVGPSGTPSAKKYKNSNAETPKKARGRPKGTLHRKKSKTGSPDDDDY